MALNLTITTPIKIVRGDSVFFDLEITGDDGRPVNLTNMSVGFYVVEKDALSNFVLQKVQTNHPDAVNGRTVISLLPSETRLLQSDKQYLFELKLFDGGSLIRTLGVGMIIVFDPVKLL